MAKHSTRGFYRNSLAQYRRLVFRTIAESGGINRRRLADVVGIHHVTLQRLLRGMLADGLIRESGNVVVRRGRAPIQLSVNPDGGRIVGLALGAHELRGVLFGLDMVPLGSVCEVINPLSSATAILRSLYSVVTKLMQSPAGRRANLLGLGYGEYGLIDLDRGVSIRSTFHRHWRNIPIRDRLQKRFNVPVSVDAALRCSLLWEWASGGAVQAKVALMVDVGDGIGLAALDRGVLQVGALGYAGEIGHMRIDPQGDICLCGTRGCLETVAGSRAIITAAQKGVAQGVRTDLIAVKPRCLTVSHIVQSAGRGDAFADSILRNAVGALAMAIGTAINLYNPDAVILRGELFSSGGEKLLAYLRSEMQSYTLREVREGVHWHLSHAGDNAAAQGAAIRVYETVFGFARPSKS